MYIDYNNIGLPFYLNLNSGISNKPLELLLQWYVKQFIM